MINKIPKSGFLEKLIIFLKKDFLIVWIILICSITTYVYGRIIFDPNPIVLGESINFWTYGLASVKESIVTFKQFPLWDSQIGAGFTLIGHPYIQQFYPLIYPFIFLIEDPIVATRFFIFTHLLLASISFFLFAASLKISKLAAFFGTIAYINSFFFYLYLIGGLFSSIFTLTWLPLILFFFVRSLETGGKWFALASAFLISLIIFAGGLYSTLFTFILLGVFFLARLINLALEKVSKKKKIQDILSLLKVGFIFSFFSLLFSAVNLLPILEYRNVSNRGIVSLANAESNLDSIQLPFQEIIINRFSNFFTFPAGTQVIFLVHWLFFLLILFSIFSKRKSLSIPLISFTVIAFIASLGNKFPIDIYEMFYNLVPGFKSFGDTTRFLVLTWFTLPLLAALGLEVFMKLGKGKIQNLCKLTSIIIAFLFLNIVGANQKERFDNYILPLYETPKSALYIKDLKEKDAFRIYNKWIFGSHSVFTYAAIQNDLSMINSLYVGAVPSYKQLDFSSKEDNIINLENKYKLFSILNTKYIVSSENDQDPQTQLTKVIKTVQTNRGNEGYINVMTRFRPRFAFIPTGIIIVGEDSIDVFNAIKARSIIFLPEYNMNTTTIFSGESSYLEDYAFEELENFRAIILYKNKIKDKEEFNNLVEKYERMGVKVIKGDIFEKNIYSKRRSPNSLFTDDPAFSPKESLRSELKQIFETGDSQSSAFEIIDQEEKPGNITIHFKAKEKGFLVYSESFYPGWVAKMDRKDVKLFMADSLVKGVIVSEPGNHTLTLSYKPKSFYIGAILSGGSVLFILVLALRKLYKRTHRR